MSLLLTPSGRTFSLALSPLQPRARIADAEAGEVSCEPRRKGVVIVAFGSSARLLPAFHDHPDYEIWGLNDAYKFPPLRDSEHRLCVSRWFEMHEMHAQPSDDLAWLSVCPVPVYMPALDARVPNGVRFPIERIEAMFPLPPFWGCTFAYQIALALSEGFTSIALLGMDFLNGSPREVIFERGNVLFWTGMAAGMGVQLFVPDESTLLAHPYRYGVEYDAEATWCQEQVKAVFAGWGIVG